MKLVSFRVLVLLLAAVLGIRQVDRDYVVHKGLNLPTTQATTRDGAFFPGVLQYDYHPDMVARAVNRAGFSSLRLAVNVETAHNLQALQKHKRYIDAAGGRGIICMFDTSSVPGASWPRTGTVTSKVQQVADAWKSVHSVFGGYGDNVLYEIFNEPWGYEGDATTYLTDMNNVMQLAGLPHDRVILAGLYGSADIRSVALAGWQGYLAYHVYVFWIPEGQRTAKAYSDKIVSDISGLSERVFITEFGVGLDGLTTDVEKDEVKQDVLRYTNKAKVASSDWHNEAPEDSNVTSICAKHPDNKWCQNLGLLVQEPNIGADVLAKIDGEVAASRDHLSINQNDTIAFLQGMRNALSSLKQQGQGVKGLHHWHGWHNGDTWDFWDAANARSSRMIQMMMMDQTEEIHPSSHNVDPDPLFDSDFVHDDGAVNMVLARDLFGAHEDAPCPEQCFLKHCSTGNEAQLGGKQLTHASFCVHTCSKPFNNMRFCGVGDGYIGIGAIDCNGCARPAMCFGLPCWSNATAIKEAAYPNSTARFLQKRA